MSWKKTDKLMDTIRHYASFPATGVSLRQMVQFGEKPSTGTLFRASQFLAEELPIRLAHRVQELETLPDGLGEMPSVKKVADWYAQSFEVWLPVAGKSRVGSHMTHDTTGDHTAPKASAPRRCPRTPDEASQNIGKDKRMALRSDT
jgi:hypothetical protein